MSASEAKPANSVTLFSNGMGHFRRVVTVRGGQVEKISIPFNRGHISDVLESLSVFGNVRLASPPSFTPTNSNSTSLSIDPSEASRSLYTNLSGAAVRVSTVDSEESDDCTLLGLETEDLGDDGEGEVLVLLKDGKVARVPMADVDTVEFVEESVRSEIEKALKNNFQRIKPESTFLDLALSSLDLNGTDAEGNDTDGVTLDETAVIQYKIPVAAWKMRYNIRQNGDRTVLEGTAIIDNNTDEDWNDVLISVVTGNPISFQSPKMAAITVPVRQVVDVVDAHALGAVGAEEGVLLVAPAGGGRARGVGKAAAAFRSAGPMAAYSSVSNAASFGLECASSSEDYCAEPEVAAASPGVESKEVGDFCVFTSKEPISIASKRSAIVPMFAIPLTTAGTILIYKESDHPRRPYRAVKFKNEATFDLGKGKVVIYIDDVFSGEAVLETAKPGENRILPHCLENGVKVVKEDKGHEQKVSSISFSRGVALTKTVYTHVTEYDLTNKKDETFKLLIEHPSQMGSNSTYKFSGIDVKEVEKVTSGIRAYVELESKQTAKLVVTETFVSDYSIGVVGNYRWIHQQIVGPKHPLADDAHIRTCASLQASIDEQNRKINALQTKIREAEEDSNQLRKNIESSKSAAKDQDSKAAQIQSGWVVELDALTKEIKDIRKTQIPAIEVERDRISKDLDEELARLTAVWSA